VAAGLKAEVVQDASDGEGVGHEGDDAHALAAAGAEERIHLVDLGDEPRPAWRAAPLRRVRGRRGRFGLCLVGAADAVGVLTVEERPVLAAATTTAGNAGDVVVGKGGFLVRPDHEELRREPSVVPVLEIDPIADFFVPGDETIYAAPIFADGKVRMPHDAFPFDPEAGIDDGISDHYFPPDLVAKVRAPHAQSLLTAASSASCRDLTQGE
jgi:hypothetical protein